MLLFADTSGSPEAIGGTRPCCLICHVAFPLPADLACIANSSCNNTVFMEADEHWECFLLAVNDWIAHHHLVRYPEKEIKDVWDKLWQEHAKSLDDHWTVAMVNRLKLYTKGLIWHVRDHEGSHAHVFCPVKYWMMLQNTFTVDSVFKPSRLSPLAVMTQMEQAVPEHIMSAFPFRFASRPPVLPGCLGLTYCPSSRKTGKPDDRLLVSRPTRLDSSLSSWPR